jgi:hypothetical protein
LVLGQGDFERRIEPTDLIATGDAVPTNAADRVPKEVAAAS